MFHIDPRLAEDSVFVHQLALSELRLMDCKHFAWMLLVPRVPDVQEFIDLDETNQQILMREITTVSQIVRTIWHPDKLNTAMIGNVVAQLHIHIVGRYKNDIAWPKSVWGHTPTEKYLASDRDRIMMHIKSHLS